jgi:protein-arginine kinase activator protein McsA
MRPPAHETLSCPVCGWTAQHREETGLLGCGLCYTVFRVPTRTIGPRADV